MTTYSNANSRPVSFQAFAHQNSGDSGGAPYEVLSIDFAKIEFRQWHYLPNGTSEQEVSFWDIRNNQGG